ncbi:hypothetical protein [Caudoviricetes sp.]|nr:hypothetical protein [Caudoviricetes sp.]
MTRDEYSRKVGVLFALFLFFKFFFERKIQNAERRIPA